ncbi:Uncharacterised protein [Mycobacteroides abscessus subsp. abscessus]|nr:Uncharacterised protein [Mycobacteroides abscessus subsp. abscessus]
MRPEPWYIADAIKRPCPIRSQSSEAAQNPPVKSPSRIMCTYGGTPAIQPAPSAAPRTPRVISLTVR